MAITTSDLETAPDDVLEHYGVKGMRWGVRRSEKQLAKERSSKSSSKITKRKVAAVRSGHHRQGIV